MADGARELVEGGVEDAPQLEDLRGVGVEEEVARWVEKEVEAETTRLGEQGARCVPVRVKNMGVYVEEGPLPRSRPAATATLPAVLEDGTSSAAVAVAAAAAADRGFSRVVNRVECATAFEFDKVVEILVSESKACPVKEGFKFVTVVLFTKKPIPLLLPYLFDGRYERNDLRSWLFVNSKLQESRHEIDSIVEL